MIERWIDGVCSRAGWAPPRVNNQGKYRFRLESGGAVDASSPDDRTLVLEADVGSVDGGDGEALFRKAATAVLPRVFSDGGTLCLRQKRLWLTWVVTLGALRASEFPGIMESFLNDLAFYRSL